MKRAVLAVVALLFTSGALAQPKPFTASDGTRYTFFPDGLIATVEHPDGTRETFDHDAVIAGARIAGALVAEPAPAPGSSNPCGGLYYARARYYDPCLGRFLTQDTRPGDIFDAASLNRYLFGKANPLRYVDPTGHQAVPPDDVYFREQYLRTVPPAERARISEAEAREQVAAGRSGFGGLLGSLEFFARSAWAGLKSSLGIGYEETGEQIVETASHPREAAQAARQNIEETIETVKTLAVTGQDLEAGRVLARDLAAPAASAALTAGEASVAVGRRAIASLPNRPNLVSLGDALAAGKPLVVAEDGGAQIIALGGRMRPARVAGGSQGADLAFIDPAKVRFSQSSIGYRFSTSTTIDDLAEGLRTGAVKPSDIPPIRVVEREGKLFTLDNRRLEAFRRAGVEVPYRMATAEEAAETWKFTTKNEGVSIRIRGEGKK